MNYTNVVTIIVPLAVSPLNCERPGMLQTLNYL